MTVVVQFDPRTARRPFWKPMSRSPCAVLVDPPRRPRPGESPGLIAECDIIGRLFHHVEHASDLQTPSLGQVPLVFLVLPGLTPYPALADGATEQPRLAG